MAEAISKVNEYAYRKEFGLSKAQYLEEPLDDLIINQEIMEVIGEIAKAQERMAKRGQ